MPDDVVTAQFQKELTLQAPRQNIKIWRVLVAEKDKQTVFIKEIQTRFDKKIKEQEIAVVEYWKSQLDKLISMKPDGIASLQLQMKRISDMMANRIRILKKE